MKLYQKLILIFVILTYSNWISGQPPFFTPRQEDVVTMAWNHAGDLLVVGYHSGEVSLFSQNGDFLQVIQFYDNRITAMAWSFDDTKLIISSGAGGGETVVVELWNTTDWVSQPIDYDSSDMITSFMWNPDNNYIYAGTGNFNSSHGKTLWVWDSNGQFIEAFRKSSIMGLSISPDGQKIAIGGDNIQILDADTYEEVARFSSSDVYMVTNFLWTPDGSKLISANLHGVIQMWDMNTLSPTPLIELLANTYNPPYPLLESMVRDLYLNKNELYVISGNGLVRVWNLAPDNPELLKHQFLEIVRPLRSASFNPLTHQIAYQGIDDNIEIAPIEIIYNISVSPDASKIIAYKELSIDIIRSSDLEIIASIDKQNRGTSIWSSDSNYLAIVININAVEGDIVEVWDANTGLLVTTLENLYSSEITTLEWVGNTLYGMGFEGLLMMWDMVTYREQNSLGISGLDLAISPDGQTLAVGTFLRVLFVDLDTMTILSFLEVPVQISAEAIAWSPDGQKIAVSSMDGVIRIWDVNNNNNPESIWDVNTPDEAPTIVDIHWNTGYLAVRQMYNDSVVILDDQTGEKLDTILIENGRFIWSGNIGYYATFRNESIHLHQYCNEITRPENLLNISQEIMIGNSNRFGNTICLSPDATYNLTTTLPTITGDITLIGNGARLISADNQPLFDVADGGNLTLKDVVISGGEGE